MGSKQALAILFGLIALHIALAATLASITPFRTPGALFGQRDPATGNPRKAADIGAPDEREHVNYVLRLMHGGFPVFKPLGPNAGEEIEYHQPPAFYMLAGAWSTVTGVFLPPPPPTSEGREMTQGDGVKLRWLNVLIGASTIVGIFFAVSWGLKRPEAGLVAAAFAAVLPMNAALDGAVSNDPLLICLCTWTLALTLRSMRDGWTNGSAVGVGVLAGLAILTKTTGAVLLPVILLAILWKSSQRPNVRQIAMAIVPLLVLVLPWWARNQQLYGDPLALKAFNQAFINTAQASDMIKGLGPGGYWVDMVASWTARSFIGVFGYMDIWLTIYKGQGVDHAMGGGVNTIYQVAWLALIVAFGGWIWSLRGEEDSITKAANVVNGIFFVLILASFLRFNAQYFQAQGRYLLPALLPIAAGVGIGMTKVCRNRWKLALAAIIFVFGVADTFAILKLPAQFDQRIELGRQLP